MTAISPRAQRGGWCEPADLPKGPNGRALCRRCATEVPQGRRTFCSSDCVHEWKLRTNPAYVRQKTWERDGGVCSACGTDTMAALRQRQGQRWRGHWRGTGHLWQADHIVAVAEGESSPLGGARMALDAFRRAAQEAETVEAIDG